MSNHNQFKRISTTVQPNSLVCSDENGSISNWIDSDPSLANKVSSLEVKNIKVLTQAEYDELIQESAVDLDTFYVIISTPQPQPVIDYLDYWEIYGSPTNNDGVISGFSNSNYVLSKQALTTTDSYDCLLSIKTPASQSSDQVIVAGGGRHIGLTSMHLFIWDSSSAYTGGELNPSAEYLVRVIYDVNTGETKLYSILNNGYTKDTLPALSNWTLDATCQANILCVENNYPPRFGGSATYSQYFGGEIDFNNSYLKVQ